MIVTDVGFPDKTFSRLNVFHNFFPFGLSSFHNSYLTHIFRQFNPRPVSILFCNPYQEVRAFESEIRDFSRQYFNFSLSKNRTMGAKCNRLIVHLAADQQALMLVCFRDFTGYFYHYFFFKFYWLFLAFSKFSDLGIIFSDFLDPQTGIRPLYT